MNLKPPALSEKQIQDQILMFLKSKGVFCFPVKTTGTFDTKLGKFRKPGIHYRRGVSDILGISKGKFFACEVKSAKGRASLEQIHFLQEVIMHGGFSFIARSVEDVQRELDL